MKRSEFLKQIVGIGAAAALPMSLAIDYQKIYLLQCFVRGFQYYEGPKLLQLMNASNKVIRLKREAQNKYDKYAIALYFQNHKIGFIPRESNKIISRLMDAQVMEFHAEITHVEDQAATWENVRLAIYILKEANPLQTALPSELTQIKTPHYQTVNVSEDFCTRIYKQE